MSDEQGTALIKFSETEIECLVNSLYMTISVKVPTETNGNWKKPYKMLLKEVENINYELKEKRRDYANDKKENKPPIKYEECYD